MGMIDVGYKEKTVRIAKARARVILGKEITDKIKNNNIPKGNILEIARIAAILAAKKTPELIPLCHNIEVDSIEVNFALQEEIVIIKAIVKATAKTGVEMEAMTACSVAALTIYDMCKMFSREIKILDIELLEKQGGKSGHYKREEKA